MKKWLIIVMFSGLLSVGCGVELPFTADTPKFQEGEATGIAQAWLSNCEEHYRSQYLRFGHFRESYMGNDKSSCFFVLATHMVNGVCGKYLRTHCQFI